jgi:ketosteroid isomerase-like protein
MALPVEDVLAIQRLYASYVQYFDRGDRDAWLALFTPDIVYRVMPTHDTGEWAKPIDLVGVQALADYWDFRQDQYGGGRSRHSTSDLIIDGDGSEATGSVHSIVYDHRSGAPEIRVTGRMDDELVKDDDGTWRFKTRTAYPDR